MKLFSRVAACGLALLPVIGTAAESDTDSAWWSAHFGQFSANGNSQFTGGQDGPAGALAANWLVSDHIALGLDFVGYGQEYDYGSSGAFLVSVDDRMNVDTSALSGQLLYVASGSAARFYAGGGLGIYHSSLTVDASFLGIPGYAVDKSASDIGAHVVAGFAFHFTSSAWLDLQYRRTSAEADFGQYGAFDVGGEVVMAGVQFTF